MAFISATMSGLWTSWTYGMNQQQLGPIYSARTTLTMYIHGLFYGIIPDHKVKHERGDSLTVTLCAAFHFLI